MGAQEGAHENFLSARRTGGTLQTAARLCGPSSTRTLAARCLREEPFAGRTSQMATPTPSCDASCRRACACVIKESVR